jgi:hypothetical protein
MRGTSESIYELSDELARHGDWASASVARCLLHQLGCSLQAPTKQTEGSAQSHRDAQFVCHNT